VDHSTVSVPITVVGTKPVVTTGGASNVGSTSARISGTVSPGGQDTTVHFEIGTSTSYGHATSDQSVAAGTSTHTESITERGLTPGTAYHFRFVASNAQGATGGTDHTFTTAAATVVPPPPPAKTKPKARPVLVTRSTRLRHGRVIRLRVRCSAAVPYCTGLVKLHTVAKLGGRHRILGTHAFTTGGGKVSHTHVRLTHRLSRLVERYARHHRRLRVRVNVISHTPQGEASYVRDRFTLRLEHHKHHHRKHH
jgi:hypothetical protein